jgi:hypothetical protein
VLIFEKVFGKPGLSPTVAPLTTGLWLTLRKSKRCLLLCCRLKSDTCSTRRSSTSTRPTFFSRTPSASPYSAGGQPLEKYRIPCVALSPFFSSPTSTTEQLLGIAGTIPKSIPTTTTTTLIKYRCSIWTVGVLRRLIRFQLC